MEARLWWKTIAIPAVTYRYSRSLPACWLQTVAHRPLRVTVTSVTGRSHLVDDHAAIEEGEEVEIDSRLSVTIGYYQLLAVEHLVDDHAAIEEGEEVAGLLALLHAHLQQPQRRPIQSPLKSKRALLLCVKEPCAFKSNRAPVITSQRALFSPVTTSKRALLRGGGRAVRPAARAPATAATLPAQEQKSPARLLIVTESNR